MQFVCSKCKFPKDRDQFHEARGGDRRRPVTSQCRTCRSEAYFEKRYPEQLCAQCQQHRPLEKNRICGPCNEESGLRQCRGPCEEILPLFLKFYGERKVCKDCAAKLRRLRRKTRVSNGSRSSRAGR